MSASFNDLSSSFSLALAVIVILLLSAPYCLFLFYRPPSAPPNAPKYISGSLPVLGAVRFWTARWDFFRDAMSQTKTGNFSYKVGPHSVVGVSGDAGREVFFGSAQLSLSEGYNVLFGAAPKIVHKGKEVSEQDGFSQHFSKRLNHLLQRKHMAKGLRHLIGDTKARLNEIAASPTGITDPFDSIYDIVFQLTMRTIGCNDMAEDPVLLKKTLRLFETVEQSATASAVIFPWAPSPAVVKRIYAGSRLYMILKRIVDERKETGKREDDPLQYLIDLGDDVGTILQFITGALFAGQLNTGINAAYVLAYLAAEPHWMSEARREVEAVVSKYAIDTKAPLSDQLSYVPLEAWETGFPVLDLCLRESIRLNLPGTAFRQNISGRDIKIGDEVIPDGHYVAFHLADIHQNPSIYVNPEKWDPSRYLPDRAEDKKAQHAYAGWGAGRHPCIGMRFAQLENRIITAYFLAMFDYSLCHEDGTPRTDVPPPDLNLHFAHKPEDALYLKYRVRDIPDQVRSGWS